MKFEGISLLNSILTVGKTSFVNDKDWLSEFEKIGKILDEHKDFIIEEGFTNQCIYCAVQIVALTQTGFEIVVKLANYIEEKGYPD